MVLGFGFSSKWPCIAKYTGLQRHSHGANTQQDQHRRLPCGFFSLFGTVTPQWVGASSSVRMGGAVIPSSTLRPAGRRRLPLCARSGSGWHSTSAVCLQPFHPGFLRCCHLSFSSAKGLVPPAGAVTPWGLYLICAWRFALSQAHAFFTIIHGILRLVNLVV